jgi:hypothetical protein
MHPSTFTVTKVEFSHEAGLPFSISPKVTNVLNPPFLFAQSVIVTLPYWLQTETRCQRLHPAPQWGSGQGQKTEQKPQSGVVQVITQQEQQRQSTKEKT